VAARLHARIGVDFSGVRWVQAPWKGRHARHALGAGLLAGQDRERRPTSRFRIPRSATSTRRRLRGPDPLSDYPSVARLFPDYRQVERDYFRRTGICPIMHLVVVKKAVYDKNPWIAESLAKALEESRRLALQDMQYPGALRFMLPWLAYDLEEIDEIFGGDPCFTAGEQPRDDGGAVHTVEQNFIRTKILVESCS
jgi:4,5-dihydroxyphthalate decarboxylase